MNRKIYSGTSSLDYFIMKVHLFGKKEKLTFNKFNKVKSRYLIRYLTCRYMFENNEAK